MSKVSITGNASGTGTFTIAAPNSNTDRTLNLPDEAGEVVVTDGTTLVVDNTNDKVGIGTSSPAEQLEVYGTEASGGVELLLTNYGDGGGSTTPYAAIRARLNPIRNGGEIRFGRDGTYSSAAAADSNIQFYTAVDDVNTERMRIDSSGIVTTPNQPSFHAYANFNLNHGTSTTKYVWNLTRHNIGSHYDTSNGRFTAPIDGRYYLNIEALQQVDANSYYTRCYLYKNGSSYLDGLNTQALQSGYGRLHLNAVVEASSGDYFETYFVSNNSSAFVYATYSWFSGHLLG